MFVNDDVVIDEIVYLVVVYVDGWVSNLVWVKLDEFGEFVFDYGVVVIVVIMFCINIFNFEVMLGVVLLVCNVVEKGLILKLWVKIMIVLGL